LGLWIAGSLDPHKIPKRIENIKHVRLQSLECKKLFLLRGETVEKLPQKAGEVVAE
jgi:hypothetical protein